MRRTLILIAHKIDTTQRQQIHALIRDEADDWWHQMDDAWFITSEQSAKWWRDLCAPVIHSRPSAMLVLYADTSRGWAARAPGGTARLGLEWLKRHFKRNSE